MQAMEDGDYVIDHNYNVSQYHKHLGHFVEWDDMMEFIKYHMEANQFWPDVWQVSDHGNWSLVDG